MEKQRDVKSGKDREQGNGGKSAELQDREALKKPSKDKREVTIGPTTGTGPDITIG